MIVEPPQPFQLTRSCQCRAQRRWEGLFRSLCLMLCSSPRIFETGKGLLFVCLRVLAESRVVQHGVWTLFPNSRHDKNAGGSISIFRRYATSVKSRSEMLFWIQFQSNFSIPQKSAHEAMIQYSVPNQSFTLNEIDPHQHLFKFTGTT